MFLTREDLAALLLPRLSGVAEGAEVQGAIVEGLDGLVRLTVCSWDTGGLPFLVPSKDSRMVSLTPPVNLLSPSLLDRTRPPGTSSLVHSLVVLSVTMSLWVVRDVTDCQRERIFFPLISRISSPDSFTEPSSERVAALGLIFAGIVISRSLDGFGLPLWKTVSVNHT